MKLQRMDCASDPYVSGVLCTFPSGCVKQISWRHVGPIPDSLAMAKKAAAELVQHMLQRGLVDDLERTNIPSMVAALQRIVSQHGRVA
jgi:hypothetical protein